MMTAHTLGACVVAVYPRDIAETKAQRATDQGRKAGYPLTFTTEPEEYARILRFVLTVRPAEAQGDETLIELSPQEPLRTARLSMRLLQSSIRGRAGSFTQILWQDRRDRSWFDAEVDHGQCIGRNDIIPFHQFDLVAR